MIGKAMRSLEDCRLYAFVDTAYLHGRKPAIVARELCKGGADIIQLRAKNSSLDEARQMAETILPVTRAAGVPLVINDHVDIAREFGVEFCHLGQEDFFDAGYEHVDELPAPGGALGIGLSSHAPVQAARAIAAGADYIAVGPVYATNTKPAVKPVTLDFVRWAAANVTVPWFSIGGINLENLEGVIAAGARRVCVVSAILEAEDTAATCRKFLRQLRL